MFGQSGTRPICTFYQKGNCKYGAKCYNYHPGVTQNVGGGFGATSATSGQSKEFMEFVAQISTEMNKWESSGMWLLSVLAPLKEHPAFPDFTDTSPEELRAEAYEAKKLKNPSAYENKVREKLEFHKKLRMALKSDTPDAVEVMKSIFYKTGNASFSQAFLQNQTGSLFGKPTSTSLFGGNFSNSSSSGNSVFGQKPASSIFGGPATFGPTSSGGFGSFKSSTSNVFGGGQTGSIFGNAATSQSSSIFGAGASQQPQNSTVFGSSNQPQGTSVFGGGTAQQSSFFGSNGNQAKGMFGANPQTSNANSPFGSSQGGTSLFGGVAGNTSQNSGILFGGNPQTSNSVFGNKAPNAPLFGGEAQAQAPQSIFGAANQPAAPNAAPAPSPFGGTSQHTVQGLPTNQTLGNNASIFGGNSAPQANQGLGPGGSIFGGTNQAQDSNQLGNKVMGSSNIFGGNSTQQAILNAGHPSSGIFGSSNSAAPSSTVFSSQSEPSFGDVAATTNPASVFGNQSSASDGASPTKQPLLSFPTQNQSSNLPSAMPQIPATSTAPPKDLDSSSISQDGSKMGVLDITTLYTGLTDLSKEDRAEFESPAFTRIPSCPPPRELCH